MKRKTLTILLSAMLACSATAILFACGDSAETYSVTYAKSSLGEEGSVPTDSTKYEEGEEVTVKDEGELELDGYTFAGWTDGTKVYQANEKYTMPAKNVTFTATWEEDVVKYTVSYVLGEGGSWTGNAPAASVNAGTELTLPAMSAVTKDGSELTGWIINEQNYEPGDVYTVNGDVTITAVWGVEKFSIYYAEGGPFGAYVLQGRYEEGTEIDIADVPETWSSETKEFVKWTYNYYNDEEQLVTGEYQPGDKFIVPAKDVTFRAEWESVAIYINFYLDNTAYSNYELPVDSLLYNPDSDTPFELPQAGTEGAPEGLEFLYWAYEIEVQNPETYVFETRAVEFDLSDEELVALLEDAIYFGDAEFNVYGIWGKKVTSVTLNTWNVVVESVPVQYGQTVTLTGNVSLTANNFFDGAFGCIAKSDDATVNTHLRWDWWIANSDSSQDQNQWTALGFKTQKLVTMTKNGTPIELTNLLWTTVGCAISDFKVVMDYSENGKIVLTTTFTSTVGSDVYAYTGTLTITANDPHVGLAQSYLFGIGGEHATVTNVVFAVEGAERRLTPPASEHDWTAENNYKCTVCGQINPNHQHNFVDNVCTICGTVQYSTSVGGTTYSGVIETVSPFAPAAAWWERSTEIALTPNQNFAAIFTGDNVTSTLVNDAGDKAVIEIYNKNGNAAGTDAWKDSFCLRVGNNAAGDVWGGLHNAANGTFTVKAGAMPEDWAGSYRIEVTYINNTLTINFTLTNNDATVYAFEYVETNLTYIEGAVLVLNGGCAFMENWVATYGTLTAE